MRRAAHGTRVRSGGGVLLLLSLAAWSCGRERGDASPVRTEAGSFSLSLSLDREALRQKGNTLWVTVEDSEGQPVEGASVNVHASMPAMGSMTAMHETAEVRPAGAGRYRARFDLPMGGTWTVELDVATAEELATATYSATVGSRGLTPMGATGGEAKEGGRAGGLATGRGDEVAYYTCSMHPSVRSTTPGRCPICSMDLVPVTRREAASGVITLDEGRRQAIGIRTAPVETRRIEKRVRAVGRVVYDETRLVEVSVKYRGWIGRLHADSTGMWVGKGSTLFTLYSPDLYAAQEEYLTALASQREARATSAPDRADYLVEAARKRLSLWDVTEGQIDEIAAAGKPVQYLPIVSSAAGFVVEKNIVEGAAVEPGMRLYRLAGLDQVWIEAEVYEADLPLVRVGQPAEVGLSHLPGRRFSGKVSYVLPYLDGPTRTGRVRIVLANPNLELKPDMYAQVELVADLGEHLVVPEEAVLYAGERSFVFRDLGEGRLKPQRVELGSRAGDEFPVISGLAAGDEIVTSGNFLVAAESRLKLAMEQWQ